MDYFGNKERKEMGMKNVGKDSRAKRLNGCFGMIQQMRLEEEGQNEYVCKE